MHSDTIGMWSAAWTYTGFADKLTPLTQAMDPLHRMAWCTERWQTSRNEIDYSLQARKAS
jgi:hypothetical protein